ncbi:MAG: hypothetical protein V1915_01020 [Candidatus Bathyarchaeota archaeon]
MKRKELERKLKLERVEACVNCKVFTECDGIGVFGECEDFSEVEAEKAVVMVRRDEYSRLESK